MRRLMEKVGAQVVAEGAILTEGDPANWPKVISLGHILLFKS
jgi:hypothetical protein